MLIIIDGYEGNLLFGRFLILRNDVPGVLNRRTRSEREIQLLSGENIKEESRFVWGVADKVILGEYNHHAIRHFAHPMMFYLDKIFNVEDSDVRPIRDSETFSLMRSEREMKKFG